MSKVFQYDEVPIVQTKAGAIQGYALDGVYIFKGVPYARAKRFQMPTEVEPWDGVRVLPPFNLMALLMTENIQH